MENKTNIRTLLVSGNTLQDTLQEWNVDEIIKNEKSKNQDIERLVRYEWDNRVSRCGMTYLEIEQFNNRYNY
jgi:hypothetical protein